MQTYQNSPDVSLSIPSSDDFSDMMNDMMQQQRRSSWSWSAKSVLVVLSTLAVAAVVALANRSAPLTSAAALATTTPVLMGSSSSSAVTACTFDECFASRCNADVAPYTCLVMNGGPHGGCSAVPWTVPETCTTQCNLSHCNDLSIPSSTKSCAGEPCDAKWCNMGRICGADVPYQCTSGASTFGCSSDKFQWTFRTASTSCSSCCDSSSCS
jgi:hypothetical protein